MRPLPRAATILCVVLLLATVVLACFVGGETDAMAAAGPALDDAGLVDDPGIDDLGLDDGSESKGSGGSGALLLLAALALMIALGSPLFVIIGVIASMCFLLYGEGYDDWAACATTDPDTICRFDTFPAKIAGLTTKNVLLAIPFFVVSGAIMSAGDIANRLVRQTTPDGVTEMEWDDFHQIAKIVGPGGELAFERDELGQVVREIQDGIVVEREFDVNGRKSALVADGTRTEFHHMPTGHCDAVRWDGGSIEFELDALGRETVRKYGFGGWLEHTYDTEGRTQGSRYAPAYGAAVEVERVYGYDRNGVVTSVRDNLRGATSFIHTPAGVLVGVLHETGASRFFGYDANGGRKWMADVPDGGEFVRRIAAGTTSEWHAASGDQVAASLGGVGTRCRYGEPRRLNRVERPDRTIDFLYDDGGHSSRAIKEDFCEHGERLLNDDVGSARAAAMRESRRPVHLHRPRFRRRSVASGFRRRWTRRHRPRPPRRASGCTARRRPSRWRAPSWRACPAICESRWVRRADCSSSAWRTVRRPLAPVCVRAT